MCDCCFGECDDSVSMLGKARKEDAGVTLEEILVRFPHIITYQLNIIVSVLKYQMEMKSNFNDFKNGIWV